MEQFSLIIFGITGNLAQIKLIPALYDMEENGTLPEKISIIGISRQPMSKEQFTDYFFNVLNTKNRHHEHEIKQEVFKKLCQKLNYMQGSVETPEVFTKLKNFLDKQMRSNNNCDNRIFYLATYPSLYKTIFDNIKNSELNNEKCGWVRILIEKPIGNDFSSAKELNTLLKSYFSEDQIYRLDHYLGKETLQNILTFRFGNGIFEPLINNKYIDHIQITASEDFGVGKRGNYYNSTGALKDVGQNHLIQMAAFATMESPARFNNQDVTAERVKIIKNLVPDPKKLVLGQYEGYLEEEHIPNGSKTDTYFALRTEINSERFKGIPIYMRAGKYLNRTVTEISIVFKTMENRLFKALDCGMEPNVLIYRIQPNEGIILKILAKDSKHNVELKPSYMQFCYRDITTSFIDPYERLIYDALAGDQTFFNDAEEVEAQWKFVDDLQSYKSPLFKYEKSSWGPKEADALIGSEGREWLEPSVDFCAL